MKTKETCVKKQGTCPKPGDMIESKNTKNASHWSIPLSGKTSPGKSREKQKNLPPCLVGENPTSPVPTLQGCEGLWSCDYGHA